MQIQTEYTLYMYCNCFTHAGEACCNTNVLKQNYALSLYVQLHYKYNSKTKLCTVSWSPVTSYSKTCCLLNLKSNCIVPVTLVTLTLIKPYWLRRHKTPTYLLTPFQDHWYWLLGKVRPSLSHCESFCLFFSLFLFLTYFVPVSLVCFPVCDLFGDFLDLDMVCCWT